MRLRGSPVPHAGRVEVRLKHIWGTITCDYYKRNIDPILARVICRQLNFTDGILATERSVYVEGTGITWFYNYKLKCTESASNLLDCGHREPYPTRRSIFDSDLSVVCKPDVPLKSGKLTNFSDGE